jgi:hypothetical protein
MPRKSDTIVGSVLGQRTFAAISAVEGLKLSPEVKRRSAASKAAKLTTSERRDQVLRAYSEFKKR